MFKLSHSYDFVDVQKTMYEGKVSAETVIIYLAYGSIETVNGFMGKTWTSVDRW